MSDPSPPRVSQNHERNANGPASEAKRLVRWAAARLIIEFVVNLFTE